MDRPVRFLHSADFHLGSRFVGAHQRDASLGKKLREAVEAAYANVINIAIEEQVDFVCFAGDLFNTLNSDYAAQGMFIAGLERLNSAGIEAYYVTGNHDPFESADRLSPPPNAHLLGKYKVDEMLFEKEGVQPCAIYGISYPTSQVDTNFATLYHRGDVLNAVGILHTNVGPISAGEGYARCDLQDLKDARMDYWALGHIHKTQVVNEQNPCVIYAGTPQALHINEQGPHGCYIVELDHGRASYEWRETGVIDVAIVPVDLNGAVSRDEMRTRIIATLGGALNGARPTLVRLQLTGTLAIDEDFDEAYQEKLLKSLTETASASGLSVYFDSTIIDETTPSVAQDMALTQISFLRHILDTPADDLLKDFDFDQPFTPKKTSQLKDFPDIKARLSDPAEFQKLVEEAKERLYRELMKGGKK